MHFKVLLVGFQLEPRTSAHLTGIITRLGGTLVTLSTFEKTTFATITHIVCKYKRTPFALAAALSGDTWITSKDWLEQSDEQNRFIMTNVITVAR